MYNILLYNIFNILYNILFLMKMLLYKLFKISNRNIFQMNSSNLCVQLIDLISIHEREITI